MSDKTLPPHSIEAEEGALGSILINEQSYLILSPFLKDTSFYAIKNKWVWDAIVALYERGDGIDNITVVEELRAQGHLEDVGGSAYITYLINITPTHIHADTYGRIVDRTALRRRLLSAASRIAYIAGSENEEIDQVIDEAEDTLLSVTAELSAKDLRPMRQIASTFYDVIEKRQEFVAANGGEPMVGLPTGLSDLDRLIGGLRKSELIIVAGRPGMGKTAFMLNVAMHNAKLKTRLAIFSLEMNEEQLLLRMCSSEIAVNSIRLQNGQLDSNEFSRFVEASERLAQWPMHINDSGTLTVNQIIAQCRRLQREQGLDVVIVDYLQLLSSGKGSENRVQEVGAISRGLKKLSRELNVPVVAAAQLSRAVEQRQDKRPQLSDLRESGDIEADADIVIFLYRDDVYNDDSERPNQCDFIVAKHRNGPTGAITAYFRREVTRFDNMTKHTFSVR